MPSIKVYIHFVWSTKDREPFLNTKDIRQRVWQHIMENAQKKDIYVMQLIKGESSFWINNNKLCNGKFGWQDEYFAVSVSESMVDRVRDYIKNQEEHHKHKTFQEEYDEFIEKFGFQKFS